MTHKKTRTILISTGIFGIITSSTLQNAFPGSEFWKLAFLGGLLFIVLGTSPKNMINPIFDKTQDTSEKRIQEEK